MQMLQTKNPQMFNMINQAKNSGTNPQDILKQFMGNSTPQDMENVMQQARQMRSANRYFTTNAKYE